MKIQKAILVIFLAVMFLPLTPAGGFAQMDLGGYNWSGDVEMGGRFLINSPNPASRGYLEEYTPSRRRGYRGTNAFVADQ